jgi:hypothetical protein
MDLLKTPKQLLLEEQGAPDGKDMLLTPKQVLMEESGVMQHFAKGKKVLSPEDMKAEIFVQSTTVKKPTSHPALINAWNKIFK